MTERRAPSPRLPESASSFVREARTASPADYFTPQVRVRLDAPHALEAHFVAVKARMHDVWLVAGTLERDPRTSLPFVVELTVQLLQGTRRDITGELVSTLRVGQIRDLADQQASRAGWRPANAIDTAELAAEIVASRAPAKRGRPPKPDRFYMTIAAAYLYYEYIGSRTPVADLAVTLGLKPQDAKRYVERARRRRFLTPGIQGRSGAWAGPALWDCLGGELGLSEPNQSWRDRLTEDTTSG
jgi:hypothetical protein